MYRAAKPWKKCEDCGAGMVSPRTKKMTDNVAVTYIECPACGLKAEVWREYIRKGKARISEAG
jgi:uncharacterized Zn finger protein